MSDRRSSRAKKQVDYSAFATGEDDFADDDDFASFTPPISIKSKKSSKPKKEKKRTDQVKEQVIEVYPEPVKKSINRKSLDEKVFEKELQRALELSKTATQEPIENTNGFDENSNDSAENKVHNTVDTANITVQQGVGNQPTNVNLVKDCSDIEVLEENVADKAQRRTAPKKRVYVEDDEFSPESSQDEFSLEDADSEVASEEESGSDFDPNCDSDFEGGSNTKKNKTATKNPPKKVAKKSPVKSAKKSSSTVPSLTSTPKPSSVVSQKPVAVSTSPGSALLQPSKKIALSPAISPATNNKKSTISNLTRSPLSGLQTKSPVSRVNNAHSKSPGSALSGSLKSPGLGGGQVESPGSRLMGGFKSPGSGLGGIQTKSPASAGLRLGLSRNIRLKPLHPGIKVTPR